MADMAIRLAQEPAAAAATSCAGPSCSDGRRGVADRRRPRSARDQPSGRRDARCRRHRRYHDLLDRRARRRLAGAARRAAQRRRGLFFGDRPLCTVLRPRFLTPRSTASCRTRVARAAAGLRQGARPRARRPGVPRAVPPARLGGDAARASTPASATPSPTVAARRVLRRTSAAGCSSPSTTPRRRPARRTTTCWPRSSSACRSCASSCSSYEVRPLPGAAPACCTRCSTRTSSGPGARDAAAHRHPRLARGADVQRVRALRRTTSRAQGIECVIADPREVRVPRRQADAAGDCHIDLIYKRVLISELVERGGMDHPVVRAVRDRAVCMVNPFRCKILYKKASLAVLTDERNAGTVHAERAAGDRRRTSRGRAWSRSGRRRSTAQRGRPAAVRRGEPRAARAQAERRLRRQGHRARLGRSTTPRGRRRSRTALAEPYIVQERDRAAERAVPELVGRQACTSSTACWTPPRSSSTARTWTAA